MNGLKVVSKCPYCNNIIRDTLGITAYYKYAENDKEPKRVRIAYHKDCGRYITEDHCMDIEFQPKLSIPLGKKLYLGMYIEELADTRGIDDTIDVINSLLRNYIVSKSNDKDISTNLQSLRDNQEYIRNTVTEVYNYYHNSDFWSVPWTEDIQKSLEEDSVVCW